MKNLLLTIVVLTATGFTANSQTQPAPNGDFEDWTGFVPDLWFVSEAPGNVMLINQVPGNGGGSAVRVDVIYDSELESYLNPLVQTGPQEAGTFPIDAQYTWCLFDYKFHKVGDDGFNISIEMMDDNDLQMGYGTIYLGTETTTFTTQSLPIGYIEPATKARITFTITDPDEVPEEDGSYFIVDNVRLSETPLDMSTPPAMPALQATLFPNPATHATTLGITLPQASAVELRITDYSGREVQRTTTPCCLPVPTGLPLIQAGWLQGVFLVEIRTDAALVLRRLELEK
ncbi:MAG: T9SS type A sorting domain-containing protein [Flavobacteriales bacterium]|nr:T9SS type A sorting domain-containing protein [Flavobacteriales bacterium]